jgi:hypothetical protein
MMRIATFLVLLVACRADPRPLRFALSGHWEFELCGPAAGDGAIDHADAIGLARSSDCNMHTLDGKYTYSGDVRLTTRGDRDPHTMWCGIEIGPGAVAGPIPPDNAVLLVEDPLLAARLRTAFIGIDPRNDYDLETTREGVHLSAHQHQSATGVVTVALGVDACSPSEAPEIRRVGGPLRFAPSQ